MKGGFLVLIEGENDNPFSDLSVNVGEQPRDLHACDVGYLGAQIFSALRNEVLTHALDHFDPLSIVCELAFSLREDPFEPDQDHIPENECPDVGWSTTHEFLFKFDDRIADHRFYFALGFCIFHGSLLRMSPKTYDAEPCSLLSNGAVHGMKAAG